MRQYAGNWASAMWAFAPGAEEKLNKVTRSAPQPDRPARRLRLRAAVGGDHRCSSRSRWRSMHSQGRGLFSVLVKTLPDIDTRTVREAEFVCNSLIGFNFGDGHLHNEDLIAAVQRQAASSSRASWWWSGSSRRPFGSKVPALQGHRRGARRDRARHLEGGRRGRTSSRGCPTARSPSRSRGRWPASVTDTAVPGSGMSTAIVVGSGPNGLAAARHPRQGGRAR